MILSKAYRVQNKDAGLLALVGVLRPLVLRRVTCNKNNILGTRHSVMALPLLTLSKSLPERAYSVHLHR